MARLLTCTHFVPIINYVFVYLCVYFLSTLLFTFLSIFIHFYKWFKSGFVIHINLIYLKIIQIVVIFKKINLKSSAVLLSHTETIFKDFENSCKLIFIFDKCTTIWKIFKKIRQYTFVYLFVYFFVYLWVYLCVFLFTILSYS